MEVTFSSRNHNNSYVFKEEYRILRANSVDPDQTAPEEQSDLGPHCLLPSQ